MAYDLSLFHIVLLIGAGFIAGFINTIAGGGSMLTLPALMALGVPADIANGTNRVGVLLQSVAGARGFHKRGKLAPATILPSLAPTLIGSLAGSVLAAYMPVDWLKEALLGTMLGMAILMLVKPGVMAPPPGTPVYTLKQRPLVWAGLFFAGLYGGFVQAGVGYLLIAAFAGGLRYDLARANALKVAVTGMLTLVALGIFIAEGQVLWIPGLVMAVGTVAGAMVSVKFAISVPQNILRWAMFIIIVLVITGAWYYN